MSEVMEETMACTPTSSIPREISSDSLDECGKSFPPSPCSSERNSENGCCDEPVPRFAALTFDVIANASDSIGLFLAHGMDRCRLPRVSSAFDASSEPKIPLSVYYERVRQYSLATPETMLCAVVLIRRLTKNSGISLHPLNCHRLLVTSSMVFAKFYDDAIDSNARWARIAGIKRSEMNNLEIELLNHLAFDLRVSQHEFYDVVHELLSFRSAPPSMEHSEPEEPMIPRTSSRGVIFGFHVTSKGKARTDEVQRTQSHAESDHHAHSHSHKSILSYFHHMGHPHLNRFNTCSPGSSRESSGGDHSEQATSPRSVATPGSRPRTLPRGVSLQQITAMLHGASPFLGK